MAEDALDDLYNMTAADEKYLISGDSDYFRQFGQIQNDFSQRIKELLKIADTKTKNDLLTDVERIHGQYNALLKERKIPVNDQSLREKSRRVYVIKREEITRDIDAKLRKLLRVATEDRDWK